MAEVKGFYMKIQLCERVSLHAW